MYAIRSYYVLCRRIVQRSGLCFPDQGDEHIAQARLVRRETGNRCAGVDGRPQRILRTHALGQRDPPGIAMAAVCGPVGFEPLRRQRGGEVETP